MTLPRISSPRRVRRKAGNDRNIPRLMQRRLQKANTLLPGWLAGIRLALQSASSLEDSAFALRQSCRNGGILYVFWLARSSIFLSSRRSRTRITTISGLGAALFFAFGSNPVFDLFSLPVCSGRQASVYWSGGFLQAIDSTPSRGGYSGGSVISLTRRSGIVTVDGCKWGIQVRKDFHAGWVWKWIIEVPPGGVRGSRFGQMTLVFYMLLGRATVTIGENRFRVGKGGSLWCREVLLLLPLHITMIDSMQVTSIASKTVRLRRQDVLCTGTGYESEQVTAMI